MKKTVRLTTMVECLPLGSAVAGECDGNVRDAKLTGGHPYEAPRAHLDWEVDTGAKIDIIINHFELDK